MSDIQIRRAEHAFLNTPNRDTLGTLLSALHRVGQLSDDRLIELLRIYPYDESLWPWTSADAAPYNAAMHRDILQLISVIRPRELLLNILDTWTDTNLQNLLGIFLVVRRKLLEEQLEGIVSNYHWLRLRRGLVCYPVTIWLDWIIPWARNEWGNYPAEYDPIVTVIIYGDYRRPETVTRANRYAVGSDMEPGPDCWWTATWDSQPYSSTGRWVNNRGNLESRTLIPYRAYCSKHNCDYEECQHCEICEQIECICCPLCGRIQKTYIHADDENVCRCGLPSED